MVHFNQAHESPPPPPPPPHLQTSHRDRNCIHLQCRQVTVTGNKMDTGVWQLALGEITADLSWWAERRRKTSEHSLSLSPVQHNTRAGVELETPLRSSEICNIFLSPQTCYATISDCYATVIQPIFSSWKLFYGFSVLTWKEKSFCHTGQNIFHRNVKYRVCVKSLQERNRLHEQIKTQWQTEIDVWQYSTLMFDSLTGCWQNHLQVLQMFMVSRGWILMTLMIPSHFL